MSDLIAAVSEGARVSVFLRPDNQAIKAKIDDYEECYALPFFYSEGEAFCGITRPTHMIRDSEGSVGSVGFAYSPSLPIYAIISPNSLDEGKLFVKFRSKNEYHEMIFKTLPAGTLCFEATDGETRDMGLRQSIQAGRSHYGVMKLKEDRIFGFAIDIAYDFYATGAKAFRSECIVTSAHALRPGSFHDSLRRSNPNADALMSQKGFNLVRQLPATSTYLHIRDDGRYDTMESEMGGESLSYEWLRVFEVP